jgi:hypothetical protein
MNFSNGGSAGNGGAGGSAGGQAGTGGASSSAGTNGGGSSGSGPGGIAGGGGSGSGQGGTGAGGTAGTGTGAARVFVGGPCIVAIPGSLNVETFARSSTGLILRRAFDGRSWTNWTALPGLDAAKIDVRSDLDCAASEDTIHIVGTGVQPVGALEHAFGFGTSYNDFTRELPTRLVPQSPAVSLLSNNAHFFAWSGLQQLPGLFYVQGGMTPAERTPITSLTGDLVSAADISQQLNALFFAAFDSDAKLAIYQHSMSSGGAMWVASMRLEAPGTFAFSPAICAEAGTSGSSSVNVAAVTGRDLWVAGTGSGLGQFSAWAPISNDAASAPDCAVFRETPSNDPTIHVVTLSSRGAVLDFVGNGTSWVMADLGLPP